jgi:hypothetical protein
MVTGFGVFARHGHGTLEIPVLLPSIAGGVPTEVEASEYAAAYKAGSHADVDVIVRKVTVDVTPSGLPVPGGAFDAAEIKRAMVAQGEHITKLETALADALKALKPA